MKSPRIFASLAAILSVAQADMIIDGFTDATNDRFTNDPSFIAADHDLSGIGKASFGRWATMVSNNVFLAANHFIPGQGALITFYDGNDPAAGTTTRYIVARVQIENTDIAVGVINEPLPDNFVLPFADTPLANSLQFSQSDLGGALALMCGISPTTPDLGLDLGVGQNILSLFLPNTSNGGSNGPAILIIEEQPAEPDYVPYETFLQTGDSGAPLLQDIDGVLTVVGINWYIGQITLVGGQRNFSACSYVGNYATEIQSVIDTYAGINMSRYYGRWMEIHFPGLDNMLMALPDADPDEDGRINYDEFALGFDPNVPDHGADTSLTTVGNANRLTVELQEQDNDLQYKVRVGSDLSGWTTSNFFYNGSWNISDPSVATLVSAVDNGETWTVTLEDSTPISDGTPRFIQVLYD